MSQTESSLHSSCPSFITFTYLSLSSQSSHLVDTLCFPICHLPSKLLTFFCLSALFVHPFLHLSEVQNLCLSLHPLDIHKQWLISADYTWNSFRQTRLISASSDVIFTKPAWSDGSLLCPLWQDPSAVVYPPDTVCICIYTSEKKLLGCKQPRKARCSLWSHFLIWIEDQIPGCIDCFVMFH